jgi:hypothetical protein
VVEAGTAVVPTYAIDSDSIAHPRQEGNGDVTELILVQLSQKKKAGQKRAAASGKGLH